MFALSDLLLRMARFIDKEAALKDFGQLKNPMTCHGKAQTEWHLGVTLEMKSNRIVQKSNIKLCPYLQWTGNFTRYGENQNAN